MELSHAAAPKEVSTPPATVGQEASGGRFQRWTGRRLWPDVLARSPGLRLVRRLIWQERVLFGLTIVLTGVGALLEGIGVGLLLPFLDGLLNPEAPPLQSGWAWVDQVVLAVDAPPDERLYRIAGVIVFFAWLRVTVSYASGVANTKMVESAKHRLRSEIIEQLQAVSLRFFSGTRTGELINLITGEVDRVGMTMMVIRQFIVTGFMLVAYGVAIVLISWQLSVVAGLLCLTLLGGFTRFLNKLKENGAEWSRANGILYSAATELFGGIRTIAEFGTQAYESGRFKGVSRNAASVITEANVRSGLVGPLSQGIASTTMVILVVVAVELLVSEGALSTAALLTFLVVLMRLLPYVQGLNGARAEFNVYRAGTDTVARMLASHDKPYLREGDWSLPRFEREIRLEDVSYEYEPGKRVLDGVNLTVHQGETVAFVGASGAGKSTLADLIVRLDDPQCGRILIDGHDIRDVCKVDLRRLIAVVNQHTFLFNQSVRANIAYGMESVSEAEVRAAAEGANALEFIEAMPRGFDTVLGERGARLSGGQRQRIAIARALLRDPDILVLDEATSALDSVSERLIQESLERLMEGRTVIVIAHRLSTIESADRVVVLEAGRIVEEGTYDELLTREGYLWKYHALQFKIA